MKNARLVGQPPGSRPQNVGARDRWSHQGRPVAAPIVAQKPTCVAVKSDGSRCGAMPIRGVGICIGHKRQQEANNAHQE